MKKFANPEIQVEELLVEDVIATSDECIEHCGNKGSDDDL